VTLVHTEVDVDAPADRVWAVVSDPRNLSRWDRHIVAVRGVPPGGLRVGSEYTTEIRFMGVSARLKARVIEMDDARHAKIRLSGLMEGTVETTVEPMGPNRSRLAQRVDYRFVGGPLGALAAGAVRNLGASGILRRGVLAQKRQAEAKG
jgi:carbon monoxide dehydrogenase subunit G